MLPIACAFLEDGPSSSMPPEVARLLTVLRREAVIASLRREAEVSAVLSALARHDVRPVVLKGIALATALYPDPWLRPYGDLDLLVSESRWPGVLAAMREIGASGDGHAGELPPRLTDTDALDHHFAYQTAGGLRVECAFDPLQLGLRMSDHEGFRTRAVPLPLPQAPDSFAPSPEDDLVMLLIHLNRHGFARLVWFVDIALLLAAHPELDWDLIGGVVRREGIRTPVANSLERVARTLGFEPPSAAGALAAGRFSSAVWRSYWPERETLGAGLHEGPLVFRKSRGDVPLPRFASWTAANLLLTGRAPDKGEYLLRKLVPRKAFLSARLGDEGGRYSRLWLRRVTRALRLRHSEKDSRGDVSLMGSGGHDARGHERQAVANVGIEVTDDPHHLPEPAGDDLIR